MPLTPVVRRLSVLLVVALLLATATWWLQRDPNAAARPPVYAALGASDTVGIGADNPASEGWAPRVHAALPRGTQFLNLGINGATLEDVLRYQLPPAADAQPRLITIWGGVNDLRAGVDVETFQRQLDEVLTQLVQSSTADNPSTIVVLNIPDLRSLPVFRLVDKAALDAEVRTWNAAIADSAARHAAVLVDLYARWPELATHPEYISGDGFHPSSAGYERIAALVLDAIQPHVSSIGQ